MNSMEEILEWIARKNRETRARIEESPYGYDGFWYYDAEHGEIRIRKNDFPQIKGLLKASGGKVVRGQPVIQAMKGE